MKARLHPVTDGDVRYQALTFVCPGCIEMLGGSGVHMLAVTPTGGKRPTWRFDGNLDAPTLEPSVLTYGRSGTNDRCHSYLTGGQLRYLPDSTHSLTGQTIDLPDLPDWLTR